VYTGAAMRLLSPGLGQFGQQRLVMFAMDKTVVIGEFNERLGPQPLDGLDLRDDLGERLDLAGSQPAKRRELALRLDNWLKQVGAQMPVAKAEAGH